MSSSGASRTSRVGQTLVAGHTLRYEGAPHAVNEQGQIVRPGPGRYGRGLCSCGRLSDLLTSSAARKRWHAEHKAAIASDNSGASS